MNCFLCLPFVCSFYRLSQFFYCGIYCQSFNAQSFLMKIKYYEVMQMARIDSSHCMEKGEIICHSYILVQWSEQGISKLGRPSVPCRTKRQWVMGRNLSRHPELDYQRKTGGVLVVGHLWLETSRYFFWPNWFLLSALVCSGEGSRHCWAGRFRIAYERRL